MDSKQDLIKRFQSFLEDSPKDVVDKMYSDYLNASDLSRLATVNSAWKQKVHDMIPYLLKKRYPAQDQQNGLCRFAFQEGYNCPEPWQDRSFFGYSLQNCKNFCEEFEHLGKNITWHIDSPPSLLFKKRNVDQKLCSTGLRNGILRILVPITRDEEQLRTLELKTTDGCFFMKEILNAIYEFYQQEIPQEEIEVLSKLVEEDKIDVELEDLKNPGVRWIDLLSSLIHFEGLVWSKEHESYILLLGS